MEGTQQHLAIAALTPKMLTFYSRNPDLWFATAEWKFATAVPKITNGLMQFHYLVQALDKDIALRVKDLIMKPPKAKDAYNALNALKTRLLQSIKLTQKERASQILDYPDLGDKKAMKMADELVNFLEEDGVDLLIQEIFIRRLPQQARTILKEDEASSLHQLAVRTDKLRAREPHTLCLNSAIATINPFPVTIATGTTKKVPEWWEAAGRPQTLFLSLEVPPHGQKSVNHLTRWILREMKGSGHSISYL